MAETRPEFRALVAASFRVGCLGFGGPVGQIALMHRIFVDEKKWIDEARYLHALSYCMLLPGPEAQQLATYVGWLLHGVKGGIVAGALFVLPGALVVLALSWLYASFGETPLVASLFFGIKAAVLALVVEAMLKVARRSLRTRVDLAIAFATLLSLYVLDLPFPLVVLLAAGIGLARGDAVSGQRPATGAQERRDGAASAARAGLTALAWAALWLLPVVVIAAALGRRHVLTEVGVLFSQLAVVTFGGAYAVLAYLQQQAVEVYGWLTPAQMIDGLGLAETTPGPLILVNQFVGYMAGWKEGGRLSLAIAGAALASWCTFAPSFLWIFAGAPFAERLRASRRASGMLNAIGAAVLGVIASLALRFGAHVLLPDAATINLLAVAITLAAGLALIVARVNVILVIAGCAFAGWLGAY
jgi:chromate transporter